MNKARIAFLYLSFIFYLFIIFPNYSFSQTDSLHFKRWSVGVYGGYIFPVSNFSKFYTLSPNLSLELSYNINPYLSIYVMGTYNFLKPDLPIIDLFIFGIEPYHYTANCIDATIGGKYNFSKKFPRLFSEAAFGYYRVELTSKNNIKTINDITNNFGFNAGFGLEFYTFKNIIITTELKYTTVITPINYYNGTYYGLSSGIKYMF